MKRHFVVGVVLLALFGVVSARAAYWTDRYDVEWTSPCKDVQGNMPLGAGDMACNVWVEAATGDLMFYVQRSGSFTEIGEHIKLGRVRVTLDPNPLKNCTEFSQKLILKDGVIAIRATGEGGFETRIKLWVDQFTHSVNVTVDADQPVDYTAAYESWRTEDKSLIEPQDKIEKGHIGTARFGSFAYVLAPFEVIKLKDDGFEFDQNSVLFYHRNPTETMSPNFGIKQQGLERYKDQMTNVIANRTMGGRLFADNSIPAGEGAGTYYKTAFKSLILKSKAPARKHHIFMATHIAQRDAIGDWIAELDASCKKIMETKGSFDKNAAWWAQFWERSRIVVNPDHPDAKSPIWQMGRNYNLMRYVLGGNATGDFPTKFNGGNLTFDNKPGYDPDWRQWGGDFFTAQNQRLLYWPMLKSGDFDLMTSQFDLYMMALPGAMIRVKDAFGHGGAAFCENTDPSGINIPFCYGWTNAPGHWAERGREIPFCDPAVRGRIGAAVPVEKGVMINPSLSYYYALQLEFSYMLMERYLYTGESFEHYLPFIRASLSFYDEHYQLREKARTGQPLDAHGKLVIYPSQACEAYKGVKNPADAVSGLRACLQTLCKMDVPYISAQDKEQFRAFLARVPDFPFGELDGHRVMSAAQGSKPAKSSESPQWYPLFPYNQFTLLDDEMEIFKNTWKYDHSMRRTHIGWNQSGIFLARMGMASEALEYHKLKIGDDTTRRFPIFWGPNYDGIPDLNQGGAGMIGLQEMLMQCFGDQILLLPAWPKEVDVDFKLHAPKQTVVDLSFKNGKIVHLYVTPKERKKDVIMMLP